MTAGDGGTRVSAEGASIGNTGSVEGGFFLIWTEVSIHGQLLGRRALAATRR